MNISKLFGNKTSVYIALFLLCVGCSNANSNANTTNDFATLNVNHHPYFVLTNVNVIDVEAKTVMPDRYVYIKNGIIKHISANALLNDYSDWPIVAGNNGYITPGLIDMHVHIYEPAAYLMTLSHGVTHVRIMNGLPKHLQWRNNINNGSMIGSTSSVSSPIISAYEDAFLHRTVLNAQQASAAVSEYKAQGYDLIKAYGNLNEDALTALVNQAQILNIPVAKHGPQAAGSMSLSTLNNLQSFEHVEDIYQGPLNYTYDTKQLPSIIDSIKATDVPVTPTLNIYHQLTQLSAEKDDFLSTIPTHYTSSIIKLEAENNQVDRWLNASDKIAKHNQRTMYFLQDITGLLHKENVTLLVGSDSGVLLSPHGIATHSEMQLMHHAGISEYDVLAAATINAAKALKLDNQIGKIAPGYKADFIYTQTNPTDNLLVLRHPHAVVKNGKWFSADELNTMRDKAIENRSLWLELMTLYEAW